ncbi:hypothetical protein, conserved [Leishmania tarentolae]|uniref:Uncharacterized protein n=1 Tax=Leishmania tarentolae TaxID=5689 RepID=A0A640KMY1_LEITA|nr:hypothetical protein, conserved [Leishmania tarentolae]
MGIKGLWQALREYVDDGHLSQFRGQRVAVDMYVWLHRCIHRSVRIRTEAVVAFFDAKYSGTTSGTEPDSLDVEYDDVPRASPSPLSLDDVLIIDDQFVTLVVDKVSALQRFGVIPVCVFDGAEMPMKGSTDEERQRRRAEAFQGALVKLERLYCDARRRRGCTAEGLTTATRITLPRDSRPYEEAVQLLEKAVDISTELAHAVIQVLKEERHVECIVAPYEADAQLAYLCREGYVAAAASEDSDLIAYYCPCVISKLDTFSGKCEVLQPPVCAPHFFRRMAATSATASSAAALLPKSATGNRRAVADEAAFGHRRQSVNSAYAHMRASALQSLQPSQKPLSGGVDASSGTNTTSAAVAATASAFTYESFLLGCILSGCDYVPNLRSIGVKKAFKLVARATSLRQCFTTLECEFGFPADELRRYRHRILEAFYCFAHHLVYSPLTQEIVTYHPLPSSDSGVAAVLKTQLVGDVWSAQMAQEVCVQCLKDPCTLQLYRGVYQPCVTQYLQRTRRGQTSLRAYTGFHTMSSNRVVVHLQKQRRDGSTVSQRGLDNADFGAPLKKQCVASGFIGSSAAPPQWSSASQHSAGMALVRSRFFLVRGRTAVRERWSSSETDKEGDADSGGPEEHMGTAGESSLCPAEPMTDTGTGDRNLFASLAHCPSSLASLSSTKAANGSLTDDSANEVAAATSASSCRTTGITAEGGIPKMKDGCHTSDCATFDDATEGLPTSWMDGGGASASAASLLYTTASTLSMRDSESTRDEEFEAEGECGRARAQVVSEELHRVYCSADTPDVGSSTDGIVQGTDETAEAVRAHATSPAPPPLRCDCPFGYWQCNRVHSVFESCFLGRQWSRDEGRPPSPTSWEKPTACAPDSTRDSSMAPPPSSVSPLQRTAMLPTGKVANGYVPRAFRPPRSTATSTAAPLSASGNSLPVPLNDCDMNAKAEDLAIRPPSSKAERLMDYPFTPSHSSTLPSSPADRNPTSTAAPPPLPSHAHSVRMAVFEKMSFKKI